MAKYFNLVLVFLAFLISVVLSASVTYPGIGTFNSRDFFDPSHRPFAWYYLPQNPKTIEPTFSLYTRQNRNNADTLKFNDTQSITSSHFNGAVPTKVITHGYMDSVAKGMWMQEMKDRMLDYEDVNVIIVDWSRGNSGMYGQAVVNARVIGAMIGIEIEALIRAKNASVESFHILGHSLGAHVAAYAGKRLNGAAGRVTGLDPAGPYFEGLKAEARLWPSDGQFVDVIHTDSSRLGMWENCGNLDIYANGGASQPGCAEEKGESFRKSIVCNHLRAYELYIDAIDRNITATAHQCETYAKFEQGNCNDCGTNDQNCAILGPKAIEYQERGNSPTLKRFFIDSNEHRPLFSN